MKYANGLINKWSKLLDTGKTIKSGLMRSTLAQILENTRNDIIRQSNHGAIFESDGHDSSTGGVWASDTNVGAGFPKMVFPVLRRIFPDLIAHELVGVQAMNAPIGFVIALRARLNGNGWVGNGGDKSVNEIGFGPIDSSYTGTFLSDDTADAAWGSGKNTIDGKPFYNYDDTRLNGFSKTTGNYDGYLATNATVDGADMGKAVLGAKKTGTDWSGFVGGSGQRFGENMTTLEADDTDRSGPYTHTFDPTQRGVGIGAPNSKDVQFADIVHGTYPTVGFGLERKEVVARTRKLGAHWSPELAEDMQVMHQIDVETEFVNMLSYEIGAEIDRQILTEMIKMACCNGVETFDCETIQGHDQLSRVIALLSLVNYYASRVAIDTRRGAANFVVASPRVCSLLSMLVLNKFATAGGELPEVPASGVGLLQKVGLINDGQQLLLRDTYANADYILLGYKGTHPGDAGIIYAPYIPVQLSKVLRPDSFTPQIGARTRYGIVANPLDGKAYYKIIRLTNVDSILKGGNYKPFMEMNGALTGDVNMTGDINIATGGVETVNSTGAVTVNNGSSDAGGGTGGGAEEP